jgi:hypothetical protein
MEITYRHFPEFANTSCLKMAKKLEKPLSGHGAGTTHEKYNRTAGGNPLISGSQKGLTL